MKKSYQILEPEALEELFNYKKHSLNVTISLLSWFSYKLSNEFSKRKINVEIDVVKVRYQSEYPAIGAYYRDQEDRDIDEDDDDVENLVDLLIGDIIKSATFFEYFNFINTHNQEIKYNLTNYNNS